MLLEGGERICLEGWVLKHLLHPRKLQSQSGLAKQHGCKHDGVSRSTPLDSRRGNNEDRVLTSAGATSFLALLERTVVMAGFFCFAG